MRTVVRLDRVEKQLRRLPRYVVEKLEDWANLVENLGLREVCRRPGYHDEPLQGIRFGQRSVRLTRSYRAIYVKYKDDEGDVILVKEVTKHEY